MVVVMELFIQPTSLHQPVSHQLNIPSSQPANQAAIHPSTDPSSSLFTQSQPERPTLTRQDRQHPPFPPSIHSIIHPSNDSSVHSVSQPATQSPSLPPTHLASQPVSQLATRSANHTVTRPSIYPPCQSDRYAEKPPTSKKSSHSPTTTHHPLTRFSCQPSHLIPRRRGQTDTDSQTTNPNTCNS